MSAERVIKMPLVQIVPKEVRDEIYQNDKFWITKCPYCVEELSYHKTKLYISKDETWGWCHRCNTLYLDTYASVRLPDIRGVDIKHMTQKSILNQLEFDMTEYKKARISPNEDDLKYLLEVREASYLLPHLEEFGIRFSEEELFIPYPDELGNYTYFVKRIYYPKSSMKYFLPPIRRKPYYHLKGTNGVYIIVEGQFDALAMKVKYPDYNVISLSGTRFTAYMLQEFRNLLPEFIVIYLDDTELSESLRDQLKEYIIYAQINVIPSNGMDPEEYFINETRDT